MRKRKLTRYEIDALRSQKEAREAAQHRQRQFRGFLLRHARGQRRLRAEQALAEAEATFWRLIEEARQRAEIMHESKRRAKTRAARRKAERMVQLLFEEVYLQK